MCALLTRIQGIINCFKLCIMMMEANVMSSNPSSKCIYTIVGVSIINQLPFSSLETNCCMEISSDSTLKSKIKPKTLYCQVLLMHTLNSSQTFEKILFAM